MRSRLALALTLDMAMLGCLLAGLAYPLTGNAVHEGLGLAFFGLVVAHNVLNRKWYVAFKWKQHTLRQRCNTVVMGLLLALLVVFVGSSVVQSQTLFPWFLDVQSLETRRLHTTLAWWGFVLVGLHVGVQWNVVAAAVRQTLRLSQRAMRIGTCLLLPVSLYGGAVFVARDMPAKLLGLHSFEYWDFGSETGLYFAGYVAVLGVLVAVPHFALRRSRP